MTPPFPQLRYCVRCCMPETQEGLLFDEAGICQACNSSEQKMHIDWAAREAELAALLERAKADAGNNYDCIIPISGGKDSVFQLHVLTKVYGMKPLAVTYSHNWYSRTGYYNLLNCLEQFEVDHIQFTPSRKLVNKSARRSLETIGDACWHCHAGVGAFPLQIAVKFGIKLLIWGESVAEASGRASHFNPVRKFDAEYFTKVSAKLTPDQFAKGDLTRRDLHPLAPPTQAECDAAGVFGIHLGDYIFWDEERQTEFIKREYNWLETDVEGAYKGYKSAECIMPGVHDFTNYLKRGYGRSSYQAAMDVRNGLMDREEAWEIIKEFDTEEPYALQYFLKIAGYSKEEFYSIMEKLRKEKLQGVDIPVREKTRPSRETLRPFVEEFIETVRAEHKDRQNS
jgi:N-acetyl sugar amidotransferase